MIRLHRDRTQNYNNIFDHTSGIAARWSFNNNDLFWREAGPELLDISITNYCERECEFCYRNAKRQGDFMELSLYENIIRQAEKIGVQQIALGGGNPNQHPDFVKFLKIAREHHIVASYTTNGQGMTEEIYQATKMYGGAVAVSWYTPFSNPINVIEECGRHKITANIHFVLHKKSLLNAIELFQSKEIPWSYLNAIIFLNYKPLGLKIFEGLKDDESFDAFLKQAITFEKCKIGFDSCMISWLMKKKEWIAQESIDFCEAGRFSAFVSEKGFVYPCSFLCENTLCGESIKEKSLVDIWQNGSAFIKMRHSLSRPARQKTPIQKCTDCADYDLCHGGCQEFEINRCV